MDIIEIIEVVRNITWAGAVTTIVIVVYKLLMPVVTHYLQNKGADQPYYKLKEQCDLLEHNHFKHLEDDYKEFKVAFNQFKRDMYEKVNEIEKEIIRLKK